MPAGLIALHAQFLLDVCKCIRVTTCELAHFRFQLGGRNRLGDAMLFLSYKSSAVRSASIPTHREPFKEQCGRIAIRVIII
ncbi:MAG: hypothetical protein LBU32_28095 [Clostridiales bacterium]|nr:hypothetical protein [Clostridiales bacterium]